MAPLRGQNDPQYTDNEYVVLLHGLGRTSRSMNKLRNYLQKHGYKVINVNYPSRKYNIRTLSEKYVEAGIRKCIEGKATKIHFVTHSLGGILLRDYFSRHPFPPQMGRVVMLAPPNKGSEVVDKLKWLPLFQWLNGPAGNELGTDSTSAALMNDSLNFETGIIAGDFSINLILSLLIPGPDDGKVAVKNTRIKGMKDFILIHTSHPFIMRNRKVLQQILSFLQRGEFTHSDNQQ